MSDETLAEAFTRIMLEHEEKHGRMLAKDIVNAQPLSTYEIEIRGGGSSRTVKVDPLAPVESVAKVAGLIMGIHYTELTLTCQWGDREPVELEDWDAPCNMHIPASSVIHVETS